MQQNRDNLIEICQILAEQEHLKVSGQEIAKGALAAGVGATIGGIVGGPIGLAIGGSLASATMGLYGRRRYRSVVDILKHDLSAAQKRKLEAAIRKIMRNIQTEDIAFVLSILGAKASLKQAVIKEIGAFLMQEMHVRMIK